MITPDSTLSSVENFAKSDRILAEQRARQQLWEQQVREGGMQRTSLGYPGNVSQADDS